MTKISRVDLKIPTRKESRLEFSDSSIAIYNAFRNQVHNPQSVLYPSCGFDASPSKVFDSVTFVDIENGNEGCINELQKAGLRALSQDIRNYVPKTPHDLLILLNPATPTEWASRHLKSGGYVLSNNYHGNASEMYKQPDQFTLFGTIDSLGQDKQTGNNLAIVSRDLEGLFQPVKDAEEFQRLRPNEFEFTKALVLSFINQRIVSVDADSSFGQKWAAYRETMQEGMPSKRAAERYIFVKK